MNRDSYKIVISISHHRIAFGYWLRDGEDKLVPMPGQAWPAPLAFYCTPQGIEIGQAAVRAAQGGVSNAFVNYFERQINEEAYEYAGQTKPLRYVLLDAAEAIFTEFFRQVLLGSKGTLEDNVAIMPVTIVCEPDIKPNERVFLLNLFKSRGYNRLKVVDYNNFIERYARVEIAPAYQCDRAMVAWTEGADLIFTSFGLTGQSEDFQASFPGLGVDPRMRYVKKLIWGRVYGQNQWIKFEDKKKLRQYDEAIGNAAAAFINSNATIVSDTITLDDKTYYYDIQRAVIDNLRCDESESIRSNLAAFMHNAGMDGKNTLLMLRGIAAGNTYFEHTICRGFPYKINFDRRHRSGVMRLIIADENPVNTLIPGMHGPQFAPAPAPREKAAPEPKKNFPPTNNANAPAATRQTQLFPSALDLPNINNTVSINVPPVVNEPPKPAPEPKGLRRRWRETLASAKGKQNNGRSAEAIATLRAFKDECMAIRGAEAVIAEIDPILSEWEAMDIVEPVSIDETVTRYAQPKPVADDNLIKGLKKEWIGVRREVIVLASNGDNAQAASVCKAFLKKIKSVPGTVELQAIVAAKLAAIGPAEPVRAPQPQTDGAALIAQGKLKEAREAYRMAGDLAMVRDIKDIMHTQKGVEKRIASVDSYRNNPNAEQIRRIVAELQEYVELCGRVGYACGPCKAALAEYKKILKHLT